HVLSDGAGRLVCDLHPPDRRGLRQLIPRQLLGDDAAVVAQDGAEGSEALRDLPWPSVRGQVHHICLPWRRAHRSHGDVSVLAKHLNDGASSAPGLEVEGVSGVAGAVVGRPPRRPMRGVVAYPPVRARELREGVLALTRRAGLMRPPLLRMITEPPL